MKFILQLLIFPIDCSFKQSNCIMDWLEANISQNNDLRQTCPDSSTMEEQGRTSN